MSRPGLLLFLALAVIAAVSRLLLQTAVMPPYAGLDEPFHVARLAFVAAEGRNPSSSELSVPPYLAASMAGAEGFMPAYSEISWRWPGFLRARQTPVVVPRPLGSPELRPYVRSNYQAQHPSLYYTLAAPLAGSERNDLAELRRWRLLSIPFAVAVILATAAIGFRTAGQRGAAAAVLLVSVPTWLTVVARASNDAFACALLAAAIAISWHGPRSRSGMFLEALAWAAALAAKLYSWPVAALLPFLWIAQRASRTRWAIVTAAGALAAGLTSWMLRARAGNALGLFMFESSAERTMEWSDLLRVQWLEIAKMTVASGIWASGPHWNALTPAGMALYAGPVLALFLWMLPALWRRHRAELAVVGAALVAFGFAQLVSALAYLRDAPSSGPILPAGGKEGWYWLTLAPLLAGVLLARVLSGAPRTVAIAIAAWLVGWDVLLSEGALFQDYAGLTSAAGGDWLLRWGPRDAWRIPVIAGELASVSAGPLVRWAGGLRLLHLASAAGAIAVAFATPAYTARREEGR